MQEHRPPQQENAAPPSSVNPAVLAAASILRQDLETPPRLLELARRVGLSHPRLNRGFRQCFGTTAFGYLRILRLEEARQLLEEGKTNVTDAAYSVGYQSLPSFSRAFSDRFGLCPREFLNRLHRQPRGPKPGGVSERKPG